jgi:D-beta-D-heptose 7-phosphate kinase/D-beta-D-heptose 1-phosphate adenosyltransferase
VTSISVRSVLEGFPGKRLLVLGDVMLDENLWGEVRRVSPEAPVPVVELRRQTFVPGGAANSAANAVGLGGIALLGGVVGADGPAARLREGLGQLGVDTAGLIVDHSRPTTTKTRVVAHSQQVLRIDREVRTPISPAIEHQLLAWVELTIGSVGACVISDYAKGVVSPKLAREVLRLARSAGTPVVVDPKGVDYRRYQGATVITPNLSEAEQAARLPVQGPTDLRAVGRRLRSELPGTAILITRGGEGMTLFTSEDEVVHVPAEAQAVFDVTGAGDTASATLALALAAGAPLTLAVRLANRAAGVVVGKVGTTAITLAELRRARRTSPATRRGAAAPHRTRGHA